MNRKSMKEYRIWKAMKARCYAPSNRDSYYQRDGIKVCDRWKDDFPAFLADMGRIPGENYSIERIDYHGDYCPENCVWIPFKEQQKNRRNVPVYEYLGESHGLTEWCRILGLNMDRIRGRLRSGMPFEEAILEDPHGKQVRIGGTEKTVSEWCKYYGLNQGSVYSRIKRGWSRQDAILKNQHDIVRR